MLKKLAYSVLELLTFGKGVSRTINGIKIKFPAKWSRYYEPDYEADNYSFLKNYVKPGMHIIDIGAHLGLFSACSSQLTGSTGKIICFEPTPGTYEVLKKTLALNKCDNVTPLQQAVGAATGETVFFVSSTAACNSNSLVENVSEGNAEKYNVTITTIDDIVNTFQLHPDLIKIDAEGAELDVLKGGIKTLNEKKPTLILGLHPKFIKQKGDSLEAIWEILMSAHYKIEMEGSEITKETFCNSGLLFDVHCY